MDKIIEEVLASLDEFLVYRTEGKLDELRRVRNKLRQEREKKDEKHAGQACKHTKDFTAVAR